MLDMHEVLKKCYDPTAEALRVTGSGGETFTTVTSAAGAAALDASTATNFFIELTENTTLTINGETDGRKIMIVVKQDAGGTNTLTLAGGTFLWEAGTAPVITVTGDAVDVITLAYVDELSSFVGSYIQDFQA